MDYKNILIAAGVALVVALMVVGLVGNQSDLAGSTSDSWSAASFQVSGTEVISSARALSNITSLTVGSSGTAHTQILSGTCDLDIPKGTQAATTTKSYGCSVSNVQQGDKVFVQLASSTPETSTGLGWWVSGAGASTTAGAIDVRLINGTGTATKPPRAVASSTQYWVVR